MFYVGRWSFDSSAEAALSSPTNRQPAAEAAKQGHFPQKR
jgi:hypothetical protein